MACGCETRIENVGNLKTANPTPAELGIKPASSAGIPWTAVILGAAIGWAGVMVYRRRSKR